MKRNFSVLICFGLIFFGILFFSKPSKEPETPVKPLVGIEALKEVRVPDTPSDQVVLKASTLRTIEWLGFESDELLGWEEKVFGEKSLYHIEDDEGGGFKLVMSSAGSSSAIAKKLETEINANSFLTWEWRVQEFPPIEERKRFNRKEENDYAVRIYLMFKGLTFLTPKIIQYVWDKHYPVETFASSPYVKSVQTIVVRTGLDNSREWQPEKRNIWKDYQKLFGKLPKKGLQGLGIMCDSDNAKGTAAAEIRNIYLKELN